jgi:hypothetical protein
VIPKLEELLDPVTEVTTDGNITDDSKEDLCLYIDHDINLKPKLVDYTIEEKNNMPGIIINDDSQQRWSPINVSSRQGKVVQLRNLNLRPGMRPRE